MKYVPPTGGADGDPYVNPNPAIGLNGSPVPAGAIEFDQREIDHIISHAGLTPTNGDLQQLRKAVDAKIAAAGHPQLHKADHQGSGDDRLDFLPRAIAFANGTLVPGDNLTQTLDFSARGGVSRVLVRGFAHADTPNQFSASFQLRANAVAFGNAPGLRFTNGALGVSVGGYLVNVSASAGRTFSLHMAASVTAGATITGFIEVIDLGRV